MTSTTHTRRMTLTESAIDRPVIDPTGVNLGVVAALDESYFKVRVPMGFDFWLPHHVIAGVYDDSVELNVLESELDEHKVSVSGEETDADDPQPKTMHPAAVEGRYEAQAEFFARPHQL